jgi:hypothetical protein
MGQAQPVDMTIDVDAEIAEWRAEALAGERVSREICTDAGELLNYHARVVPRPLDEVYRRLSMMGGGLDDCWPLPSVPMKVEGALAPGVRAGHGPIRYELAAIEPGVRIKWRFTMQRPHGRYEYRLAPAGEGTLVENVIDGLVTEALIEVWPSALGRLHDWVMERLLDRLAGPPAPWFDPGKIVEIR